MKNKKSLVYILLIVAVIFLSAFGSELVNNQNTYEEKVIEQVYGEEFPENFSLAEDSDLQIFFFDVGQADSCLVVDNGQTMMIDSGDKGDGELLVKYIKQLGITKIDYLIGTHAHSDHIGRNERYY